MKSEMLYSTENYRSKRLRGIEFRWADFSDADFVGQDLSNATFDDSVVEGADFRQAIVNGAVFSGSRSESANFASQRISREQLYSTASYQQGDLRGLAFFQYELDGWDLEGQDLRGAKFIRTKLGGADMSLSDMRGMQTSKVQGVPLQQNAILADGTITGLNLDSGDTLTIRDDETGILVQDSAVLSNLSSLEFVIEDRQWDSIVAMEEGISIDLDGTMILHVDDASAAANLIGARFDLFDWQQELSASNRFQQIETNEGFVWDVSQLYTTGEVQLLAIPEPDGLTLLLFVLLTVRWLVHLSTAGR